MKFSAALVSIALLTTSALAAPMNVKKRCRARTSSAVATTSTAALAESMSAGVEERLDDGAEEVATVADVVLEAEDVDSEDIL